MKRIERYEISQGSDRTEIRVKPSSRMAFSLFLAGVLLVNGLLLRWLSGETTGFVVLLAIFGVCYGVGCFLPLINKARFIISDTAIVQEGRFIAEGSRYWDLSEIQEVLVFEVKGRLGKLTSPNWQIAIIDQMGDHFGGAFRLESEERAHELARWLSELIGVGFDTTDDSHKPTAASM